MKRKTPVLLAFPNDEISWKVWCPFCVKYHFHTTAEGHRVAHCPNTGTSPFRDTGYILKFKGKL